MKLPGDKSLSHRALILSSLAQGTSHVENLSPSVDVLSTENVLKKLGVKIEKVKTDIQIQGRNKCLEAPVGPLDCGNAGTLMRLMMGVLAGQNFEAELIGDASLSGRPMDRVSEPLSKLGAKIKLKDSKYAPVHIFPAQLTGAIVDVSVSSAQVKSALLLAGLYSKEKDLILTGRLSSRDHTERLLRYYGVELECRKGQIRMKSDSVLEAKDWKIPNDISAAAFWIVYALMAGQKISLENVLLNPSRMGIIEVLKRSGAKFDIEMTSEVPEPVGNIIVWPSKLKPFLVTPQEIPTLIDEIPIMCLLASQIDGESKIMGAQELRVKESDRIQSTQKALRSLGIELNVERDDIFITGIQKITSGIVDSFQDHRIAMVAGIASCFSKQKVEILNKECAAVSDPHFFENLSKL